MIELPRLSQLGRQQMQFHFNSVEIKMSRMSVRFGGCRGKLHEPVAPDVLPFTLMWINSFLLYVCIYPEATGWEPPLS